MGKSLTILPELKLPMPSSIPTPEPQSLEEINALLPDCIVTLNGRVTEPDPPAQSLTMMFRAVPEFCHSGDIVQGGFLTGMIDAAMAQCCFMVQQQLIAIPTLEIKVSFIAPAHPGELRARAWPTYLGKSIGFLNGELHQQETGQLIATATSTVKLIYAPKNPAKL